MKDTVFFASDIANMIDALASSAARYGLFCEHRRGYCDALNDVRIALGIEPRSPRSTGNTVTGSPPMIDLSVLQREE